MINALKFMSAPTEFEKNTAKKQKKKQKKIQKTKTNKKTNKLRVKKKHIKKETAPARNLKLLWILKV